MRQLITIISLLLVLPLHAQQANTMKGNPLSKLAQVYQYLNRYYVEEVDMSPLVEAAIRSMLDELDPHSAYLSAEEMQSVTASFDGEFSGIGVEFNISRDSIVVVNTIAGGPAETVGVRPNDRIVRIDSLNAVGFKQSDVTKHLRGKQHSRVEIDVERHGEPATLHFVITRDKIPLTTIDAAYTVEKNLGYIKVNRFGRTTMEEFRTAYNNIGTPGGLILDLRGNGGGIMEQAIEMASFFLPRGAEVVSTEGRAVPSMSYCAERNGVLTKGPLVVLIDESSASASEIVAGAIQDWDRGIIVGRPSFGKGLVQRQVPLQDNSAVRITIARYHTPSGRVIQRPYEKGKRDAYALDHLRRYDDAVRDSLDAGAPAYKTLRNGRTVYGGGGIRPDVMIENDTTGYSAYYGELFRRGAMSDFAVEYLDSERTRLLERYPTVEAFVADYQVTDETLQRLIATGERRGITYDAVGFEKSRGWILSQVKALVAQRLYGVGGFYRVMNAEQNESFKRGVALIQQWERNKKEFLHH